MNARFFIPKRVTLSAFAGVRLLAFARFNSTSSSSRAARVAEIARSAEKPTALEASVPVMWVVSGVLAYTAFNRIEPQKEDYVEKLLIV